MKITVPLAMLLMCSVTPRLSAQATKLSDQKAGDCSIVIKGNGNNSRLVCEDIDSKVAKQIKAILDGTARNAAALDELSKKLDDIINTVSDRYLTPLQLKKLETSARAACATGFPKINVTAANGNQEAQRFAMDFVNGLKASGCDSDLALPIPGLRPDITGVHVAVR